MGIITPAVYVVFVKKQALSEIGISKKYWLLSIILGIVLGVITYFGTLATIDLPPFMELLPLAFMAVTVGLFEAIFFRGWIQLRFENAFGAIPAIPIGAAFYALYHVGYGMSGSEVLFLFFLGLTFAIAFRVTKNVLVLWPFYTWIGGLYTNITEGQVLPFEALYGFVIILMFMIISIVTIRYIQKRRRNNNKVYKEN
ncbi:MAG: CPBP family intramembrane metalloprotease [Candidatus Thermoplasmatota archaeon]|nr:CPBP family intramembrane metalloprotease [Candidatus Thermoplasmatota archaeon]